MMCDFENCSSGRRSRIRNGCGGGGGEGHASRDDGGIGDDSVGIPFALTNMDQRRNGKPIRTLL